MSEGMFIYEHGAVPSFGCLYCDGYRCPCSCESDCGARARDHGHCCQKAPEDVIRAWLISTGLYPELEHPRTERSGD